MRDRRRRALPLLGAALLAAAPAAALRLPTVPAHWTDETDDFEPQRGAFTFDALSFASPDDGWIVGNRYLLHVTPGGLELHFTRAAGIYIDGVDASRAGDVFLAGSRAARRPEDTTGVVLRRVGEEWREEQVVVPEDALDWWVTDVRAAGAAGFALGLEERGPSHQGMLWQRDGDAWRVTRPYGWRAGDFWVLLEVCFDPSGDAWFVGREWTERYERRALVVRHRAGAFEKVPIAQLAEAATMLNHVACLADGQVVATGAAACSSEDCALARGILLRYDGDWHGEWFPEDWRGQVAGTLAPLSADDVWLTIVGTESRGPTTFVHWHEGHWEIVPPPRLPEGRTYGYSVMDMQFVSPSEGWAVAQDSEGPDLIRGLIFHYKDGLWRHRNWNWHFWHQPYFGLIGD